ncbi:sialic acid synthase, partial [Phlebotomus argentipes]|uniref:sialic acid synthase n=1 Tax=Phlebotomus argentipes TaxID=94469 RepID=UPI0028929EB0
MFSQFLSDFLIISGSQVNVGAFQMALKVCDKIVGEGKPCFIVAEIGQNHQGDINLAKELILEAKQCGVDCVKFQRSNLSAKFTRSALERPYTSLNSFGATYGEHKSFLEFSAEDFRDLQRFSAENDIIFTASAMDEVALDELLAMGVPLVKIGSGDANNLPLIKKARDSGVPLIISTGMQRQETIEQIHSLMAERSFGLLHCVSSYPTRVQDANIQFIEVFQKCFPKAIVGYSGHEIGQEISLAAVAMGAKIVERHFTLDKNLKGSDHKCSLEPKEMSQFVENVRKLEHFLGEKRIHDVSEIISALITLNMIPKVDLNSAFSGEKCRKLLQCEIDCFQKLGKSLVFSRDVESGEVLTQNHLAIKVSQPKGLQPEEMDKILGRRLSKAGKFDTPIQE